MMGLFALLLLGCAPTGLPADAPPVGTSALAQSGDADPVSTSAPVQISASAESRALPSTAPPLHYWAGRAGRADLFVRRGRGAPQLLGSLETAPGYLPLSGISERDHLLATVAVPAAAPGHPQRADLLVGPPAGPWERRSADALRLQRPVLRGGALYWIRLDAMAEDGTLSLSAMRDQEVLRAGDVSWMQYVSAAEGVLLYELSADGRATLRWLEPDGGTRADIDLGRGQARNFEPGPRLWMHWKPEGADAVLRGLDLRSGDSITQAAPGFGARSFVLSDQGVVWSDGVRFPELDTGEGVLWRGPGPIWTLDGVPVGERGEGISWVGALR